MFERRLKIFLLILVSVTTVLVLRAVQVQIVQIGKSDGPTSVAASLAVLLFGFALLLILSMVTRGRRRTIAADPAVPAPTPTAQPGAPK